MIPRVNEAMIAVAWLDVKLLVQYHMVQRPSWTSILQISELAVQKSRSARSFRSVLHTNTLRCWTSPV
jgi:hypothetical protein